MNSLGGQQASNSSKQNNNDNSGEKGTPSPEKEKSSEKVIEGAGPTNNLNDSLSLENIDMIEAFEFFVKRQL